MYAIERLCAGAQVSLRVAGLYEEQAATELRARLSRESDPHVVLDFSAVEGLPPSAMPMLVPMLLLRLRGHPERSVRLAGLGQGHREALRCFGLELGVQGEVAVQEELAELQAPETD